MMHAERSEKERKRADKAGPYAAQWASYASCALRHLKELFYPKEVKAAGGSTMISLPQGNIFEALRAYAH